MTSMPDDQTTHALLKGLVRLLQIICSIKETTKWGRHILAWKACRRVILHPEVSKPSRPRIVAILEG